MRTGENYLLLAHFLQGHDAFGLGCFKRFFIVSRKHSLKSNSHELATNEFKFSMEIGCESCTHKIIFRLIWFIVYFNCFSSSSFEGFPDLL